MVCAEPDGCEDAHHADVADREGEQLMPTMAFDYDFYSDSGERVDPATQPEAVRVTALVMKDLSTGSVWCHRASCKGPKDVWLMRRLVMDIESAGHSAIRLKSDGEPATKAGQASLIARRLAPRRTIPVNPPADDPLARALRIRHRYLVLGIGVVSELPRHCRFVRRTAGNGE